MAATETLGLWGIVRPAEVIEIAAQTGLSIDLAAALLEQESGGGHNVWGHDGVNTGGIYVKGSAVTKEAYLAYKARRSELGSQGVGPTQLTWAGYQDQADNLGGAWDWRNNVRVGFSALVALIKVHGQADGIRRYNGSGPAAERYRDQVLARAKKWRDRLGSDAIVDATRPPTSTVTPDRKRDVMIDNKPLQGNGDLRLIVPVGRASIATARAFISAVVDGPGQGTITGFFQSDTGGISGFQWTIGFRDGRSDRNWVEVPDGTTQINLQYDLPDGGTVCVEAIPK